MTGEDIFHYNETRRSIHKHIMNYPGVRFTVLKDIFGIPEGTLRYHLRYLERRKQIRSTMEDGRRCYYSVDMGRKDDVAGSYGRPKLSSTQEKIFKEIRKKPGISQKELCSATGLNRFTMMYNVKKLISLGIVRRYQTGKRVHYEYISSSMLNREILRRAAVDLLNGKIDEDTFERIISRLEGD